MNHPASTSLEHHRHALHRAHVLPPEEQALLAERYQRTADPEAFARLVGSNLRLVMTIALEHQRGHELEELIGWGNLGLVEATTRFDRTRGVPFPAYAAYWIRARVLGFITDSRHIVRLGSRAARKLLWRLGAARAALQERALPVNAENLAAYFDLKPEAVAELLPFFEHRPESLDAALGDGERTIGDRLADTADLEALNVDRIDAARAHALLMTFRERLSPRERLVWDRRVLGDEPVHLSAIGRELGISKERVRQIEASLRRDATTFVRSHMHAEPLAA